MKSPAEKRIMPPRRRAKYFVQAVAIKTTGAILRLLPLSAASWFGSALFRVIGPFLKADKTARRNLARAFPDWDRAKIDATMREVWDNLGRGAGEFSHVNKINTLSPDGPVEVVGLEHFDRAKAQGGFVVVSAHMANWEIGSLLPAHRGTPLNNIYRTAANPWMDDHFREVRGKFTNRLIPKQGGMREALTALRRGEPMGLLLDQKLNEGVPIPFFGRDAMTANAPIEMALRLKAPILPVRLERIAPVRFRVTVYPPMSVPNSGDLHQDAIEVLTEFNALLESWIRERPGQWFWVHKRWPD